MQKGIPRTLRQESRRSKRELREGVSRKTGKALTGVARKTKALRVRLMLELSHRLTKAIPRPQKDNVLALLEAYESYRAAVPLRNQT